MEVITAFVELRMLATTLRRPYFNAMLKSALVLLAMLIGVPGAVAAQTTVLVFGDSLTAGYGLPPDEAFPVKLEAALKAKGHDVTVINGGVSGDTAADGLARLDWTLTPDVSAVIVELGANDALRGLPVQQAENSLDQILVRLKDRKLPILLAGMRAPRNLGPDYGEAFDAMFPASRRNTIRSSIRFFSMA